MQYFGFLLIALAWAMQLQIVLKQPTKLSIPFVGTYTVGTALLTIDGFINGSFFIAFLNLIVLSLSGCVFWYISEFRKK